MIRFKIDVLEELKKRGYNTNTLRSKRLLSEGAIQKLRGGGVPGITSIDKICALLKKQPGQILEWIPDGSKDQEKTKQ